MLQISLELDLELVSLLELSRKLSLLNLLLYYFELLNSLSLSLLNSLAQRTIPMCSLVVPVVHACR
jgi:hypothetical protein